MINRIVVVCTGNICRSPMAEGLLKLRCPGAQVLSAGVAALIGNPADPNAVELMAARGCSIDSHRARQLDRKLLASVDLVLTLDQHHSQWINGRYPEYRGKVHKLLRWRANADVPDPYRQPMQAFEAAYELIEGGIGDWVKRL